MEIRDGMRQVPVDVRSEYTIYIIGIGKAGDGIGKIKGYTIIVKGAEYKKEYVVKITKVFPNFAIAEVIRDATQ